MIDKLLPIPNLFRALRQCGAKYIPHRASMAPNAPSATNPTQSIPNRAAAPVGLAVDDAPGAGAVFDPVATTTLVEIPDAPLTVVVALEEPVAAEVAEDPESVVVALLESLPLDTSALLEATPELDAEERETDEEAVALDEALDEALDVAGES